MAAAGQLAARSIFGRAGRKSGCPESSTSELRAAWFHGALSVLQSAMPVAHSAIIE